MSLTSGATSPRATTSRRSPPVARGLPGIGVIPYLLRDRVDYLVGARETYGDIFTLDLGVTRIIALNHPSHAQQVLRDRARIYGKGNAIWEAIRGLIGNGLPVSEGAFWLRQRRMMQPHFHRERLVAMTALMVDAIDEAMAGWDAWARSGEPLDISRELTRMTMRVIVKTMFGGQLEAREADLVGREMGYALDYMLLGLVTRALPHWVPVPGRRRFNEAVRKIDEVVFRVIERRRAGGAAGGELIGMLLDTVDAETGERMTAEELRDEAVAIFLAGYETTAVSLSFAFACLARRPEIVRAIQDELDASVADRRPAFADLPRLSYSLAVVEEALRLYPPAYWMPRTALEDDEIDGFHIPAGAEVGVMTYAMHRHPAIWDDPLRFDPGRFTPEAIASRHPLAWLPFGAGQRQCIGKEFALIEGQLILARILSRYRITAVEERMPRVHVATTLRPGGGVWVRLSRRDGSSIAAASHVRSS